MHLNRLLSLQLFYCFLGILFNSISWIVLLKIGKSLTPTEPISGIIAMLVFGFFLLAGKMKRITLYRLLIVVAIILFGYGGILVHLISLSQNPEIYYSLLAGILAVLINVFGIILNIRGALGFFKMQSAD